MMNNTSPDNSELGKKSAYDPHYNPEKLFPIARQSKRDELGIRGNNLPFYGGDIWHHYEVSWLNAKGKPIVALARIVYSCDSPFIIESKSMKLYFNSFNNSQFADVEAVKKEVSKDIAEKILATVHVDIIELKNLPLEEKIYRGFAGVNLDGLDVSCNVYEIDATLLQTQEEVVEEIVCSDLLKSNCLVTNQPDWGSVQIAYCGKKINHESLLKYLVSFRNHNEFHEQCIERIFVDIMRVCQPQELTVYGRYTRRGGLDINPFRSTQKDLMPEDLRFCRQ